MFNRSTMTRRRWSNSATISLMNASPWFSAATAAFWAMDVGLDVLWLCTVVMAVIRSFGPAA